jgi:hypothetical protein
MIIDLVSDISGSAIDTTTQDVGTADFVYYERCFGGCGTFPSVDLDWIKIEVSAIGADSCSSGDEVWYTAFYWGDAIDDNNDSIPGSYYPPENDNQNIPITSLYNGNSPGFAIDLDAVALGVPAGTYRCMRFTSPLGGNNDGSEIDSIQGLP